MRGDIYSFYADYRRTFEKTELGRIKLLLLLHEMAENFGLVNKSMMPKRGRPSQTMKEKDFVRQELARIRATAMDGSFGTQKEHFDMRRIKARKKETEILYIFLGIHAANVTHLAERLAEQPRAKAA